MLLGNLDERIERYCQTSITLHVNTFTALAYFQLLDLPLELHEHILLEAIISEIRDRKLVRNGWKDSADRAAERLRNVCPQWDSVLTTNSFRNRLHGIIDTFRE